MKYLTIPSHQLLVNESLGASGKFTPLIHLVSENHTYTGDECLDDVFLISLYPERLGFYHALCDVNAVDWSQVQFTNHTDQLDVISGMVSPLARISQYFDLANDQIKFIKANAGVDDEALGLEHLQVFLEMMLLKSICPSYELAEDKKTLKLTLLDELGCTFHLTEDNKVFFSKG